MLSKITNTQSKKNEVSLNTYTKNILLKRLTHQGPCNGIPSIIPLENKRPLTAKIAIKNIETKKNQEEIDFQRQNYFLEKSYISSKRTNRPVSFHLPKSINISNIMDQTHKSISKSPLSKQACTFLEKMLKNDEYSILLEKSTITNNDQEREQRLPERKKTLSLLPSINESAFNISRTSFTRKKTLMLKNQKNIKILINSKKNSRPPSPAPKILDKNEESEYETKSEFSFVRVNRIDEFIELIQDNKVSPNEFIYLLPKKDKDCYDLRVVDYSFINKINAVSFYTMSSKGVTLVEKGVPKEFILLGDWMREREQYSALKKLKFFKNFRKWKSLKKWFQLLRLDWNRKIAKKLNENLFSVQNVYQRILLKHREYCLNVIIIVFLYFFYLCFIFFN